MNSKEIGEIRRHIRRDRSNISQLFGCYVNANKEIISEFRLSTGLMSENEGEKYFNLLRRSLSGSIGKNLIDISFQTAQVAAGEEHKLLMDLRGCALKEDALREQFYRKVLESVPLQDSYLILLGCDSYDVPFRSKDGSTNSGESDETYTFILCAVCPVKQTTPMLQYVPEEKQFHDSGIINAVCAPELGFLFPAFDNRATNIYNALYYTRSAKENHQEFVDAVFRTPIPQPAAQQKKSFEALLGSALDEQCSLEVVQTVHDQLCQRIELHRESKVPEPLLVTKEDVKDALKTCGVSEGHIAKFGIDYDEIFGFEAELHPKNIIDSNRFEIRTPDVSIRVSPDKADLIETRVIGGVKYILICADEDVEVNGVRVHIGESETTAV